MTQTTSWLPLLVRNNGYKLLPRPFFLSYLLPSTRKTAVKTTSNWADFFYFTTIYNPLSNLTMLQRGGGGNACEVYQFQPVRFIYKWQTKSVMNGDSVICNFLSAIVKSPLHVFGTIWWFNRCTWDETWLVSDTIANASQQWFCDSL